MEDCRRQIILDYAKWTVLSAFRSGAPIKSRKDIYPLIDAVAFADVLSSSRAISASEFDSWHEIKTSALCSSDPPLPTGWSVKLINIYRVLQRPRRRAGIFEHHVVRAERADTRLVHRKLDGGADDVRIGFVDGTPVVGKQQEPAMPNRAGVYPRVCGGAGRWLRLFTLQWGLSPRVRGSLCQIIDRISVSIQLSMSGEVEFSVDRNLLTRSTPSASRISFGGSPRWRSAKPPATAPSRQIIATAPFPCVVNQSSSTAQTRSRTPDERSGDTYTPGAISSIAEARNPRYLGSTSRVGASLRQPRHNETTRVPRAVKSRRAQQSVGHHGSGDSTGKDSYNTHYWAFQHRQGEPCERPSVSSLTQGTTHGCPSRWPLSPS